MFQQLRTSSWVQTVILASAAIPFVVSASALQIASTVTLEDAQQVTEGIVVVASDEMQTYSISKTASDAAVFGVTASKPSLVFASEGHLVPVVTDGIALIQVVVSNGVIQRGDLLVTSSTAGAAMRAGKEYEHVFAVALEDYVPEVTNEIGFIQADISVKRAMLALEAKRQSGMSAKDKSTSPTSTVRAVIAAILAVGGLFFILYSFRSTMKAGVVSVGRNPRARSSIIALAVGNLTFALILFGVVVFIAVAILILPI
jgi:ABC-type multidrug transport system fused ATPase/permease subunit